MGEVPMLLPLSCPQIFHECLLLSEPSWKPEVKGVWESLFRSSQSRAGEGKGIKVQQSGSLHLSKCVHGGPGGKGRGQF